MLRRGCTGCQKVLENVDNSLQRNNLRLRGLKEGSEGDNLKEFLENLLAVCLGLDSDTEVKLKIACCVRGSWRMKGRGKDREVLIGFEDETVKARILDALWNQPKMVV